MKNLLLLLALCAPVAAQTECGGCESDATFVDIITSGTGWTLSYSVGDVDKDHGTCVVENSPSGGLVCKEFEVCSARGTINFSLSGIGQITGSDARSILGPVDSNWTSNGSNGFNFDVTPAGCGDGILTVLTVYVKVPGSDTPEVALVHAQIGCDSCAEIKGDFAGLSAWQARALTHPANELARLTGVQL